MPSTFVPFLKSGGKSGATATQSATNTATDSVATSGTFAALVSAATPGSTPNAAATSCAHTANGGAKPVVTLKKTGDLVTHIQIQCGCGQVIELECAY